MRETASSQTFLLKRTDNFHAEEGEALKASPSFRTNILLGLSISVICGELAFSVPLQYGQSLIPGRNLPPAFLVLEAVFWAVPELHTAGARSAEKIRSGLHAEFTHLVGQIAYLILGVEAAAYGKPVPEGVGIHADDGLELRGLGLEVSEILLRQVRIQASLIPLARKVCELPS